VLIRCIFQTFHRYPRETPFFSLLANRKNFSELPRLFILKRFMVVFYDYLSQAYTKGVFTFSFGRPLIFFGTLSGFFPLVPVA